MRLKWWVIINVLDRPFNSIKDYQQVSSSSEHIPSSFTTFNSIKDYLPVRIRTITVKLEAFNSIKDYLENDLENGIIVNDLTFNSIKDYLPN